MLIVPSHSARLDCDPVFGATAHLVLLAISVLCKNIFSSDTTFASSLSQLSLSPLYIGSASASFCPMDRVEAAKLTESDPLSGVYPFMHISVATAHRFWTPVTVFLNLVWRCTMAQAVRAYL